jgi:hypothetical protein
MMPLSLWPVGLAFSLLLKNTRAMPLIPGVNTSAWVPMKTGVSGRKGARPAAPVCWQKPAASARFPRCAKRVLNGPCGGSTNGKCEISKDVDCAHGS